MKFKIISHKIIDVPLITLVPIKVLTLKRQFHKKNRKASGHWKLLDSC